MSDLSKMTVEQLVDAAVSASHNVDSAWNRNEFKASEMADKRLEAIVAEARRRDAQRTAWPTGPQAAEQLARAYIETIDGDWDMASESRREYRVVQAVAVLARLHAPEGGGVDERA